MLSSKWDAVQIPLQVFFSELSIPSLHHPRGSLLSKKPAQAGGRREGIGRAAEGGETEEALAAGAEALAGGADDLDLVQQQIEEFPTAHAVRTPEPDIGGVFAAGVPDPQRVQRPGQDPGVVLVDVDGLADLPLALGSEHRRRAALDDIADAVGFPVKPAVFDREQISMAQVRAPGSSKMLWGRVSSSMNAS